MMKKLAGAVQYAKVHMGKAEVSAESPEFQAKMEVYDTDKVVLKQLLSDFESDAQILQVRMDRSEDKAKALGQVIDYTDKQKLPYHNSVKEYATAEVKAKEHVAKLHKALSETLLPLLRVLVNEHLATAHRVKQKYLEAHLQYDAFVAKVNSAASADGKAKAQASLDQVSAEYTEARDAFVRQIEVMEIAKADFFNRALPEYQSAQSAYFDEMAKVARGY